MRDFDAIVVGAGVSGAAAAALLVRSRLCEPQRVALLADRAVVRPGLDADWDLRVFALSRASERVLKLCGAWDNLPSPRLHAYEAMQVWDAAAVPRDRSALRFDSAQIGEPDLGHIVDGAHLQWQVYESARAAGVVMLEAGLSKLRRDQGRLTLVLEDGREFSTRLLIGADGVDSRVRQLAGIGTAGHAYHQDALVGHVRCSLPHENTAWQRFLPTGPLALLPLADGRCSLVWSLPRKDAVRLRAAPLAEFDAALGIASDRVLGECHLTTALASFPLQLQYALRYVDEGVVLLGDAAHVVHPLAGQGLNLGLLDCASLIEVLRDSGGMSSLDQRALRRYERWRRSENLLAAAGLDALEALFGRTDPLTRLARRVGMRAVAGSAVVKARLARQALGLAGDVPAILCTPMTL